MFWNDVNDPITGAFNISRFAPYGFVPQVRLPLPITQQMGTLPLAQIPQTPFAHLGLGTTQIPQWPLTQTLLPQVQLPMGQVSALTLGQTLQPHLQVPLTQINPLSLGQLQQVTFPYAQFPQWSYVQGEAARNVPYHGQVRGLF